MNEVPNMNAFIVFALLLCGVVVRAASNPVRIKRSASGVEIDNGLVKARFTASENGVRQEYLAARRRLY